MMSQADERAGSTERVCEQTSLKARTIRLGNREVVTEGLELSRHSPSLHRQCRHAAVAVQERCQQGSGPTPIPRTAVGAAANACLGLIVSGYDDVAAQSVQARNSYEHSDIRIGHRYAEILHTTDDGRLRIDYSRFHETLEG
ncbi:hypothetical protein [Bradyrhizobium sp. USDA 4451]